MLTEKLFDRVLLRPALDGCDELRIVSGYASAAMMHAHLAGPPTDSGIAGRLPAGVRVDLAIGMYGSDGISAMNHQKFLEILEREPRVRVRYVADAPPVHSKVFLWRMRGTPTVAFAGSANYTQTAFSDRQMEAVAETDPQLADQYVDQLWDRAADCRGFRDLLVSPSRGRPSLVRAVGPVRPSLDGPWVDLPLTDAGQGLKPQYGLNWGCRAGRNPEQAYLFIPRGGPPGFFPPRSQYFLLGTDDGETMLAVTAQPKLKGAPVDRYTAIETPEDNSILGGYLRRRIGDAIGVDLRGKRVEIEHLRAYGRLNVRITRLADDLFYLDMGR